MDLNSFFLSLRTGDYQIDNFKDFLKHVKFKYEIPSIHVAGTNGKGSTSNYIASIYRKAGKKVGLFTSPALFKVNEMISVNGIDISDEEFEKIIRDNEKAIKKYDLSIFEVQTFVAFTHFNNSKCELAIIECGMGGELDATNIFDPILSIITSISLEHTSFLGRTLSEIAYHKAGIIRENVPVVLGNLPEDALNVVSSVALESRAKIHGVVEPGNVVLTNDGYSFTYLTYKDLHIKSKAYYSVIDACIAVEAIDVLQGLIPVTNEEICNGLADVKMECRMDFVENHNNVLIDGGHNPEGMRNLKTAVESLGFNGNIRVIFACFTDKNLQGMLAVIGELADELLLTTFDNPRARTLDDYFLFAEDYKFIEDPKEAINFCLENYPSDLIIITGSLAFAAYAKSLFNNGEIK